MYVLYIVVILGNNRKSDIKQESFFLIFILFICAYSVWVISPPLPLPPPLPSLTSHYPAETIFKAGIFSFSWKNVLFAPLIYFPYSAKPEAHLFLSGEIQGLWRLLGQGFLLYFLFSLIGMAV
jgi:hypothetical protein